MHLTTTEPGITSADKGHAVRLFLTACGTFASNVVERFHEYADARLTEELTIVEQRRRLLTARPRRETARALAHRTVHVD